MGTRATMEQIKDLIDFGFESQPDNRDCYVKDLHSEELNVEEYCVCVDISEFSFISLYKNEDFICAIRLHNANIFLLADAILTFLETIAYFDKKTKKKKIVQPRK